MRLPANGTVASAILRSLLFTGMVLAASLTSLSAADPIASWFFGALTVALAAILASDILGVH